MRRRARVVGPCARTVRRVSRACEWPCAGAAFKPDSNDVAGLTRLDVARTRGRLGGPRPPCTTRWPLERAAGRPIRNLVRRGVQTRTLAARADALLGARPSGRSSRRPTRPGSARRRPARKVLQCRRGAGRGALARRRQAVPDAGRPAARRLRGRARRGRAVPARAARLAARDGVEPLPLPPESPRRPRPSRADAVRPPRPFPPVGVRRAQPAGCLGPPEPGTLPQSRPHGQDPAVRV